MTVSTPKIIHFLWLDFNNKRDGMLDEKLNFFKKRIELLHPTENGWTINFIHNWDNCISSINGEKWLLDLLNNQYIGPAHKSDTLRYYYLYKMGGVWVDISTFIVSSFDNLVEQNKGGFTCYYMPSDVCASWLIKLSSDIYENITMKQYTKKFKPIQDDIINIKNRDFNFITENYFLISSKGNKVCKNVLDQLRAHWTKAVSKIKSKEDYCYENNKLIYKLIRNVYNIDIKKLTYLGLKDILPETERIILIDYFDCGYFFNYLQLYLAIRDYSVANNGILTKIENSKKKKKVIAYKKLSDFSKELCYLGSCNNLLINFKNTNNNIHLLSASYNRLSKWSDDRAKRISWENTLAGDILKDDDPFRVLKMLNEIEINQLKYSAFTRNSVSLDRLMKLFGKKLALVDGDIMNKKKQRKSTRHLGGKIKTSSKKSPKKYKGSRGGIYIIRKGKKVYQ